MRRSFFLSIICCLLSLSLPAQAARNGSADPLDVPALPTRLTTTTQLSAIAHAGKRLVAVGIRGLIITSDDEGTHWTQRLAPVSSDLLAVHFPTPQRGWAVGHDGVVLHSKDGGLTWVKQLDGRQAALQLIAHFQKMADAGDETGKRLLAEMKLNYESGPEQALLDVWFEDEQHGFVCGSFGTLLFTADGGKSWQSWIEKIDYETLLHLNAIRGIGNEIFMASEKGIVFRLDRSKQRFAAVETGYTGSFFSLAGRGDTIVAAGLRGSAYRSTDAGKNWSRIDTGLAASVTGAATGSDGALMLVSQNGSLLYGDLATQRFTTIRVPRPTTLSGIVATGAKSAVVVGLNGVQQVQLK